MNNRQVQVRQAANIRECVEKYPTNWSIGAACMFGLLLSCGLFAAWAPHDAMYELHSFVRFLNYLI